MSLVVRADSDPRQLADGLRNQVRLLDPSLAVADIRLMDLVADESIATPRFAFFLVGLFAGLAILPKSMAAEAGLIGVPLRPAITFSVAFIVPRDRPLSPVTRAFADLVTTTHQEPETR